MQREWIKKQESLVKKTSDSEKKNEYVSNLKTK